MKKVLVFATGNKHKAQEVQQILGDNYEVKTLKDIGCFEDIPETSDTMKGNAKQKALYVVEKYGFDCFAEDSGLEVDALDGAPGVITARYAGPQRDNDDNMALVLKNLEGKANRGAQFKTVIALIQGTTATYITGICRGTITNKKTGDGGFGYDPIFRPDGYAKTFAELGNDVKNAISHRGKATRKLAEILAAQ